VFDAITPNFYRGKNAILIVFDVARYKTFKALTKWIEQARLYSDAYAVIVGNKSDSYRREVSARDAANFASQNGMQYFEVSAKNGDVYKVFDHLIQELPRILPGIPIPHIKGRETPAEAVQAFALKYPEVYYQSQEKTLQKLKVDTRRKCCITN